MQRDIRSFNGIVALTGPIGSGKTTAAGLTGMHVMSFASPMKKAMKELFLFSDEQLTTLAGKETVDPRWGMSPRKAMQTFGTDLMRKWIPGFWVKRMDYAIDEVIKSGYKGGIAIDDVRFEDEADLIRSRGGVIVHIVGRKMGDSLHKSENGIMLSSGDVTISNTGSIQDLNRQISRLLVHLTC